ncbi:MAG: HAD-IB family hydrolase [Actinobacteria bacterium]|nr:HAD-IB family hydrolase [Actinomycetota bacterium]
MTFNRTTGASVAPTVADPDLTTSRVVLVDVDRTLLRGSSLVALVRVLVAAGLVPRRTLLRAVVRGVVFSRLGSSDRQASRVMQQVLRSAKGCSVAELAAFTEAVAADLRANLRTSMELRLRTHIDDGDFVVLLSAAPQQLVESLAEVVGAHRAVGTRGHVADGRFTGELDGAFCYGSGKLERLRSAIGPVDLTKAVAYADSASDLPILASVGSPIAVQPDRHLRSVARHRGWPVLLD